MLPQRNTTVLHFARPKLSLAASKPWPGKPSTARKEIGQYTFAEGRPGILLQRDCQT